MTAQSTTRGDSARFLLNWARHPLQVGAVAPSGRAMARAMAASVDLDLAGPVVEIGPGTGAVTRALLERMPGERLVSIEYNPDFAAVVRARHPSVRVVEGDAYAFDERLADAGVAGPVAAVVSGLPLFTQPLEKRRRLLHAVLDRLAPGGAFIQFSYARGPAFPPEPSRFSTHAGPWILRNLPPARVWRYVKA